MYHPLITPDHEAFRQTVRKFIDKEIVPFAEEWDEAGWFPSEIFQKLGAQGFLGAHYPEQYGGTGLDFSYSLVLGEELGKAGLAGLSMAVAVHVGMASPPIYKFGSDYLKQRYLPHVCAGTKIACLGISEPDAGSDVNAIRTFAKRDGDDYIINGTKMWITNGVRSDFVLLVTRTEQTGTHKGITLFVVDKDSPGFTVSRQIRKVGMKCSDTAELIFDNVRVPKSHIVGEEGKGFYHIMWELQSERIIAAATSVGRMEKCLEYAMKYVQERKVFGQYISDYQVTRHKLADMATKIETLRNFTYNVAQAWVKGEYPVKEISMIKLLCGTWGFEVADMALQMHGGNGYTMEYPIQRYWRDSRLTRIGGGTDEIMHEIIAKELFKDEKK